MPLLESYLEQRRKDGYCANVFQSSKDSECSCHLKTGHSGLHRSATYRGKFYYWDQDGDPFEKKEQMLWVGAEKTTADSLQTLRERVNNFTLT